MSLILIVLLVALLVPLLAVVLDSQVGRALAARLEHGGGSADSLSDRRLAALEAEMDRLNREVQRLNEESEFLHQLLEKKRAPGALPPGERDD